MRAPRGRRRLPPAWVGVALGGGLLGFAFLADRLGVGRPGVGRGQVLLAFLGLVMVVLGVLHHLGWPPSASSPGGNVSDPAEPSPPPPRGVVAYRATATLLLTTVLFLGALEAVGVWIISNPRVLPFLQVEERSELPYYAGQDWSARHWREFRQAERTRYAPYSLWHTAPFTGETLNIDERGSRSTPGGDETPRGLRVFCFGGSAMWGYGSPDSHTIPAYLQAGLGKRLGRSVRVENRGERGYVSTQSLIELMLALQRGDVPDVVLFYDGYNEVASAFLSGRAGMHFDSARIETLLQRPLLGWLRSTWTFGFFSGLVPGRGAEAGVERPDPDGLVRLAGEVQERYLGTYTLVSGLARAYGFEVFFFWQPALAAGGKRLTAAERALGAGSPPLIALLKQVYPAMERAASERDDLYFMGHVFDHEPSQVWIDEVHTTPRGNEIVARSMIEKMAKNLIPEPADRVGDRTPGRSPP